MKKYYEILEVNPKASIEIIEKAYKVLAKKYHPDLYEGDERIYAEKKMRDINEAYKILSDEFLREQYDSEIQKENDINTYNKYKNTYSAKKEKRERKNDSEITFQKNSVGTYKGIFEVTKMVFKNRPHISIKDLKREDYIAMGITAVIMILILVAMWFIPFTNGFIRSMLPFLN